VEIERTFQGVVGPEAQSLVCCENWRPTKALNAVEKIWQAVGANFESRDFQKKWRPLIPYLRKLGGEGGLDLN